MFTFSIRSTVPPFVAIQLRLTHHLHFLPTPPSLVVQNNIFPPNFIDMACNIGQRSNMKTSIPSDVWETKRSQIAMLYTEEEWPLKQVIKRIRSDNFNPTETQLRSRLKKWGVTKPSRQRRKKSISSSGNNGLISNGTGLSGTTPASRQYPPQSNFLGLRSSAYQDHTGWATSRACMVPPELNQLALLKESSFNEGQTSGASWPPLPSLSHSATPQAHVLQQLSSVSPLSPTLRCGPAVSCSVAIESTSAGPQNRCTFANTGGSIANEGRSFAEEVATHQDPLVVDVGQPPSPWEYLPETCQPSETTFYALDGAASSYEHHPRLEHSDDSVRTLSESQSPSPQSDINFLETDPTLKSWADPSSIAFTHELHSRPDHVERGSALGAPTIDKSKEGFACAKAHLARIRTHFENEVQSSHISCISSAFPESISPLDPPSSPIHSAASEYAIKKLIGDAVRVR